MNGKSAFLRLALMLLIASVYSISFRQTVSNGGGKVGVDISTGDPGGPWGPAMLTPRMCIQVKSCDTLELEGFTIDQVILTDDNWQSIPGFHFQILGYSNGVQQVKICLNNDNYTGLGGLILINTPLAMGGTNNGNQSSTETEFWRVRICISVACPNCVYLLGEDPNKGK